MNRPAPPRPALVLVGRGRVGRTLARRARERGLAAELLPGRTVATSPRAARILAEASVVWIAVPDPHLEATSRAVSLAIHPSGRRKVVVAHASGARGPDALAACAAVGAHVASAHPAVSFGTTRTSIERATFVIDGDRTAARALSAIVRGLGARPVVRAIHGPRYHAALALTANGAAALANVAHAILTSGAGPALRSDEAARMLAGLLRSVADNIARVGPREALTGPIARGDAQTIARHLASLAPAERAAYASVSAVVLDTARARGLGEADAAAIAAVLAPALA